MKSEEKTVFVCEICGAELTSVTEMQIHERDCRERRAVLDAAMLVRQGKRDARLAAAAEWARVNEPVCLLVEHGFREQARLLCRGWASYALWDCGTSSGWEEVYDHMLQAAEEAVKEKQKVEHG
jgi:hypothetical protein